MTQMEMGNRSKETTTQRIYARVAGFLFLWLIITGLAGALTISRIVGAGTFAEQAKRVVASERLFRVAFCIGLLEPLSAIVLAFALYATLKPVNQLVAQMAMYWRLGESFIGVVAGIFGFVSLQLYTSPQSMRGLGADQSQALVDLMNQGAAGASNIGAILFSVGSLLFFYVFFESRYIPRVLSGFGVFASAVVTVMLFGILISPAHAAMLLYGWAPMAVAEVTTGFWLMFAVKIPAERDQPFARAAVPGA